MSHQRQGVIASFCHYYYKPICFQRRYLVEVICPGLRTHGCRETRQHCRISSLRFGPRHVKLRTTSLTRKQPQSWTAMNSGVESGQWLQPRASARSPSPFGPRCGESQTLWLAVMALSRTIPDHTQFITPRWRRLSLGSSRDESNPPRDPSSGSAFTTTWVAVVSSDASRWASRSLRRIPCT